MLGSKVEPITLPAQHCSIAKVNGPVAQVEERTPDKGEVRGSSPRRPTKRMGTDGFEPKGP